MLNKRIKIVIAVQQCEFLLDATRRDQRINGLPNRYPEGPEFAEVPCRLGSGDITPARVSDIKRGKFGLSMSTDGRR